jgi:transcriptional regulator with XRE-family HTH domain
MPDRGRDPSLYRRRLRAELRRAREEAGRTQREVTEAMDWSLSKLIRIETGSVAITTNDLRMLLDLYGIREKSRVDELLLIAKRSRDPSWWNQYRGVASKELMTFLGYESSASILRNFEPLVIPGLLQTEEYARDHLTNMRLARDLDRVDELIALRLRRQELLLSDKPPQTHFILDQAAISRVVGGPDVWRRQLQRLRQIAELPQVTIRVVPFEHGWYRGLRVPYVIFEFEDHEDQNVLYLENPDREVLVYEEDVPVEDEGVPTPSVYLEMFWSLESIAPQEPAGGMLDAALAALGSRKATIDITKPANGVDDGPVAPPSRTDKGE